MEKYLKTSSGKDRISFTMKERNNNLSVSLDTNNHSVFNLNYHLVLVVKYRRKVLSKQMVSRIKEIGEYIGSKYHINFLEVNYERDHMHILFKAHPKSALSKYIGAFKSASSRLIKKEYPDVKEKLWKECFWSQSYCLISTGGAPLEVIKSYIQTQGEKKRKANGQ